MVGYIVRLKSERGFGFIREGTRQMQGSGEWFFHSKDCHRDNPFHMLREGDAVAFVSEDGAKGPKAVDVRLA